ncbi:winged helix-turn-helix transcriptional regulator [Gryllotalpicola reticulitermitis]|uniref:Winged helix-turn-helix transcriptional regulator n=1 Tax=Gryllotalpicola reticulitermitis TaxID=1184153 RepID=A0ABV8Q317_9MICO
MSDAALEGFSPYHAQCPTRSLLDRIGDRWTMLVIGRLAAGPVRFSVLSQDIEGISQKMLTQTLRALERDGLATRTVFPEIPPHVEYELTELGRSLLAIVMPVHEWALTHITDVLDARGIYDAR